MKIEVAPAAGFCFGVKRAVDTVYECAKGDKAIYTYGPIVHNNEVIRELEGLGVSVVGEQELAGFLTDTKDKTLVIRAHGIPKQVMERIEQSGICFEDATCPFVKRIHTVVSEKSREGNHILIVGDSAHPEVIGIKGWVEGPAHVIENVEKAMEFNENKAHKYCIVAQTTYNYNKFQEIVEIFEKKGYNVSVVNTICNATTDRQTQTRELAKRADLMIVIGDKNSSNSTKLYEISRKECENTCFIQTLEDLHLEMPKAIRLVGITAGASTPKNLVEEVQNYVRINF